VLFVIGAHLIHWFRTRFVGVRDRSNAGVGESALGAEVEVGEPEEALSSAGKGRDRSRLHVPEIIHRRPGLCQELPSRG
jgi:hypothetical protein